MFECACNPHISVPDPVGKCLQRCDVLINCLRSEAIQSETSLKNTIGRISTHYEFQMLLQDEDFIEPLYLVM